MVWADLGVGVLSPNKVIVDLPGWIPISLLNVNLNGQGTKAAVVSHPLRLGRGQGRSGTSSDLFWGALRFVLS